MASSVSAQDSVRCVRFTSLKEEAGRNVSYYCAPCSEGKKGLVTLCNRERGHHRGRPNLHSNLAPGVAKRRVHDQDKPHPRSWSSERVAYMQ
ncbi:hypothetical protein GQ600_2435 [Phytophthora cactorum]|nr:hypothetical protein GQ600_2435 [Phytophthora cactorum]